MLIGFISQVAQAPPAPKDVLTVIVQIGGIVTAVSGLLVLIVTRFFPWLRAKRDERSLQKVLGPKFPKYQIENAVSYYIPPSCQSIDPAGGEEPRLVYAVRQKLFTALDDAFHHPIEYRYIMLLADSGMGKTAAVINYCARHLRRLSRTFEVAIVPLGTPDADVRIGAIEDKGKTVLFLDALDEDTLANVDYRERLRHLLNLTQDFPRVVLTCRTQFFSTDDEIPRRTGIMKVGARAAGETAEYNFHKIYLSPFSDEEIRRYLRRRYAPWLFIKRIHARKIVDKMPNLSVRPMLLSHIGDVMKSKRRIDYSYQLYEIMVAAWIKREEGFIQNGKALLEFSERLAIDLYVNQRERGGERASREDVQALAHQWGIELDGWYLTSRSLLNRDGEGNYKFAHRSIMEYFLSESIFSGRSAGDFAWTDQTTRFLVERLNSGEAEDVSRVISSLADQVGLRKLLHLIFSGGLTRRIASMPVLIRSAARMFPGHRLVFFYNHVGSNDLTVRYYFEGGEPRIEVKARVDIPIRMRNDIFVFYSEKDDPPIEIQGVPEEYHSELMHFAVLLGFIHRIYNIIHLSLPT